MVKRFVLQEHHSKRLHYDFRLEIDGVLRSWAVPKGPSLNPDEKRLAISVEDHPIEYINFEGIIPKDMYGAGPVIIWDKGEYKLENIKDDQIEFELFGKILKGGFSLVRFKGENKKKEWLLIKHNDRYASKSWKIKESLTKNKLITLKESIPPCNIS